MTRAGWLRLLLLIALSLGVAAVVALRERLDVAGLAALVEGLGAWAPLGFAALYALGTVLFAPGSVMTLAGGALFGPFWGTLINLTGATLGATLAFLVARYLAGGWVARRAGKRINALMDGVEAEGWRFVALVRLVPLFPFNLLNYALGLTRIRLLPYVLTSFVAMLPGAIAYTYLGYAGREALAGGEGLVQKGLLALGLLAVVVFIPPLVRRLRAEPMLAIGALAERLAARDGTLVLDVRKADEFVGELGHIEGARSLPLAELEQRLEELAPWREAPIAIVCHTDRRSRTAAEALRRAGFARVDVVRGGMVAWNREGRPVAR